MAMRIPNARKLLNEVITNPIYFQESKRFSREKMRERLREKKALFQQENGIPVYIKGGAGDRILFGTTAALAVFGAGTGLYTLLGMAFKGKS